MFVLGSAEINVKEGVAYTETASCQQSATCFSLLICLRNERENISVNVQSEAVACGLAVYFTLL